MQLIQTEPFGTHNRNFDIHTYRDTNNDSLVIEPVETTAGHKENVSHFKAYVPMKGIFDLPPEDYPEYQGALAAVKELLSTHVLSSTPQ